MRRKSSLLGAAFLFVLASLGTGCKSKAEKICQNLATMLDGESPDKPLTAADRAQCASDIQRELEGCENAETIAACYLEAKSLDAVQTCQSKCAKKVGKPAKPAASKAE